tara:strand:+ start:130 stop:450 length:321 start_codon:yes stop_codon:yes gene_type:complete
MSERSISLRILDLKFILGELEEDVVKHMRGQKAAGTRIRKALQEIRTEAQVARVQILKEQKDPKFPKTASLPDWYSDAKPKAKRGSTRRRMPRTEGWNALSEHLRF